MIDGEVAPRDPLAGLPRHGLLNVAATMAPGLYSVLLVAYFLHTMGPAGYAPWATAMALIGWLTLLDAGLASTTTREAARALAGSPDSMQRVQTTNTLYAVLAAGAAVIGSCGSVSVPLLLHLTGASAVNAWLVGVTLSLDLAIVLGTSAWMGVLRGARRFEYVLVASLTQVGVSLVATIVLLPVIGLVGAGCGQILGRVVSRTIVAFFVRRTMPAFHILPRRRPRAAFIAVGAFSLPILAMQVATQLGIGTDIVVVGMVAGPATVGMYAAGSQLARYAGQFLFSSLAVLLPAFSSVLVREPRLARGATLTGLLMGCILSAAVFGSLALDPGAILTLWAGRADPLSVDVLRLYALAFIAVAPSNILILMLVAKGQHGIVGSLVLAESGLNLALSLILSHVVGPIGVAISSLTMMVLDDLLAIPFVASRRLDIPLPQIAAWIGSGMAIGMAVAVAIRAIPVAGLLGLFVRILLGGILLGSVTLTAWKATKGFRAAPPIETAARVPD